ncbi:hypothetical protein F2Q69_00006822 [Brassica cretica]|uniref:Uncharacterized protein n=1 Tax=Brassica cretica TaxID=69181 RepID=A0A8S9NVA0_BRACR|nr:hypothetical protein F2Q69_00006822 [Brassica cretica]
MEPPTKSCASFETCLYASRSNAQASSSEIIRAPDSIISKAPPKPPSFIIFNKKSAIQEDSASPRSTTKEPVLPRVQSYSPSSMTESSNKWKTVGEKYSGVEFLQTPGRTSAYGSPQGDTLGPR